MGVKTSSEHIVRPGLKISLLNLHTNFPRWTLSLFSFSRPAHPEGTELGFKLGGGGAESGLLLSPKGNFSVFEETHHVPRALLTASGLVDELGFKPSTPHPKHLSPP